MKKIKTVTIGSGKTTDPFVFELPISWDYRTSGFIDDDVKRDLKGKSIYPGEVIQLQIIKELKKLNKNLTIDEKE